jgi:L-erythrulose 1-phosphate isomerase
MGKSVPFIGTSWKMNKVRSEAQFFCNMLRDSPLANSDAVQPFVIPPFPYIAEAADILRETKVWVGAQNMHWQDKGAWTGEVSPAMLVDCGASLVELGHSERRSHFGENDETVALKTAAALRHGLTALVCIGDTLHEYEAGQTAQVLERQTRMLLRDVASHAAGKVLIAYEPVWSIGEGGTPATPEFAQEQHQRIKAVTEALTGSALPVLYGGSVNAGNCVALANQENIDGLFIGRAAWEPHGFLEIIQSVLASKGEIT